MKAELLQKQLLKKAKKREWQESDGVRTGFNIIEKGNLTISLADIWGFCYGVLYAIDEVAKTLEKHKDKKVYVLGDLIHNPYVNNELKKRGAIFIDLNEIEKVTEDDLVVVPAFGTTKEIFGKIKAKNLKTINTTCPEVHAVEKEVAEFNSHKHTAVIHGKYEHQESIATSSFAEDYLIIRDKEEASYVCDYIIEQSDKNEFMKKFEKSSSNGFNPEIHLQKIGMANQTTMLMNESIEIFEMFRVAIEKRDGNADNFKASKTICSATQDRQDAVINMTKKEEMDLFIDVGGHTSSNTKNLAITAAENSKATVYHIEDELSFDRNSITHLPLDSTQKETKNDWLTEGKIRIGITAGASTPHDQLEKVIQKLLTFYS